MAALKWNSTPSTPHQASGTYLITRAYGSYEQYNAQPALSWALALYSPRHCLVVLAGIFSSSYGSRASFSSECSFSLGSGPRLINVRRVRFKLGTQSAAIKNGDKKGGKQNKIKRESRSGSSRKRKNSTKQRSGAQSTALGIRERKLKTNLSHNYKKCVRHGRVSSSAFMWKSLDKRLPAKVMSSRLDCHSTQKSKDPTPAPPLNHMPVWRFRPPTLCSYECVWGAWKQMLTACNCWCSCTKSIFIIVIPVQYEAAVAPPSVWHGTSALVHINAWLLQADVFILFVLRTSRVIASGVPKANPQFLARSKQMFHILDATATLGIDNGIPCTEMFWMWPLYIYKGQYVNTNKLEETTWIWTGDFPLVGPTLRHRRNK